MGSYTATVRPSASGTMFRSESTGGSLGQVRITVEVANGDEIAAALGGMSKALVRKIGKAALAAGARPMLAAIRGRINRVSGNLAAGLRLIPGKGDRPGRLSLLVQSRTTREAFARRLDKAGRLSQAASVRSKGNARDRYKVYYGLMVEAGHAGPKGGSERTPAHPFMRPGFDSTVENSASTITAELSAGVDDYWLRGSY